MRRSVLTALAFAAFSAGVATAQTAPQADPAARENPAIATKHSDLNHTPSRGANSFTQRQAQRRIAKAGFTNVSQLTKDADGLWQGTAMKDGHSVNVALDFKGNVTTR